MKMKWKISGFLVVMLLAGLVALYAYILSFDFNTLKPEITAAVKDMTGREIGIEGDIKMDVGFFPSLAVNGVTFQNASWGSRPDMLRVKRFDLQLALLPLLAGTMEIRNVSLIDADIFLEVNKKGMLNLPVLHSTPDKPGEEERAEEDTSFQPAIALKTVSILNSRLVFKGRLAKKPTIIRLKRFDLKPSKSKGPSLLAVEASYNKLPVTAKGSVGTVGALTDPEKPWPVALTIKTTASELEITGAVKDVIHGRGIEADIRFESINPSLPAAAAGIDLPVKVSIRAAGHVSGDLDDTLRLSRMSLHSGKNDLRGTLSAKLKKDRPFISADFTSSKLDFRPAGKPGKIAAPQTGAGQSDKRLFSTTPFPVHLLKKVDAEVKVHLKQCLLARTALHDFKIDMALKKGRLSIKPVTAVIGAGKLKAQADVRAVKRQLAGSVNLNIKAMDAGRMLRELDISDALEGKLDISFRLSGRGRSPAEIMAGANGHLSVIMDRGSLKNRLTGLLGGDLSAGLLQLLYPGGGSEKLTQINCFVTRFDAVDGIAASRVLLLNTNTLHVAGKGTVDLKTERLDISLEPVPKKGVGADGVGKLNLSFGNLAKPFKLGGTLAKPELALDAGKTALTIGKAVGSMAIFGPLGLAALLLDGDASQKDLCASAVALARQNKSRPAETVLSGSRSKKKKPASAGTFLDGLKKMFQ